MDRNALFQEMTAEQFAAFDMSLYLDTHYWDTNSVQMFHDYRKKYEALKRQYETQYGPISSEDTPGDAWTWVHGPWPWEREAN